MESDSENATEYMLERVAIMEFDGGMKRYAQEWRGFTGDEGRQPRERLK